MSIILIYPRTRKGNYLCKCKLDGCCNFFTKPKRTNKKKFCSSCLLLLKKIQQKKWCEKNLKEYYQKNKEKYRNSHKRWIFTHNINWNELCRKQRDSNPGKHSMYQKKSKQKYPEKQLKYLMNHFRKYGKVFDLSDKEYQYALFHWSRTVKKIIGKSCIICGIQPTQSHHIFHRAKYPKLSLNVNNGVPLCVIHHNEVHDKRF